MGEGSQKVFGPQPGPQTKFLSSAADIAIYGGAAGGGKTFALLMEPLRHVSNPEFGAVFFRRSTVQVRNEGGLWDESEKLYPLLGATPKEHVLTWEFPLPGSNSGAAATVSFAHLEHDKTVRNWQGSQIPLICFDELTHFSAKQFWYMVSRNRSTCGVRPYIRATCNPDVDSWVAGFISWWIDQKTGLAIPERSGVLRWVVRVGEDLKWADSPAELAHYTMVDDAGERVPIPPKSVTFIAASLTDNKILMAADPGYMANLLSLPKVERERLLGGNWKIRNTIAQVFTNWRITDFDVPEGAQPYFGGDWGYSIDPTVLVKCYIDQANRRILVDAEAYKVGCELDDTPALFAGSDRRDPPRWENRFGMPGIPGAAAWPIRADSARPETISFMNQRGFRVVPAIKGAGSVEDGVAFLQNYEILVRPRCVNTIAELGAYSWKVDRHSGLVLPVLEDSKNHVIDALRYALEEVRRAARTTVTPLRI